MVANVPDLVIRYAETDQDVVAIHQFLLVVASQTLPGPVNAQKSAIEVWRVVTNDVALMAIRGDRLVGAMGLICPDHWWGDGKFLANRWFFCLPGAKAWRPLMREAKAIAVASGMELHLISEDRGKVTILNRSERRNVLRKFPGADADHDAAGVAVERGVQ